MFVTSKAKKKDTSMNNTVTYSPMETITNLHLLSKGGISAANTMLIDSSNLQENRTKKNLISANMKHILNSGGGAGATINFGNSSKSLAMYRTKDVNHRIQSGKRNHSPHQ